MYIADARQPRSSGLGGGTPSVSHPTRYILTRAPGIIFLLGAESAMMQERAINPHPQQPSRYGHQDHTRSSGSFSGERPARRPQSTNDELTMCGEGVDSSVQRLYGVILHLCVARSWDEVCGAFMERDVRTLHDQFRNTCLSQPEAYALGQFSRGSIQRGNVSAVCVLCWGDRASALHPPPLNWSFAKI